MSTLPCAAVWRRAGACPEPSIGYYRRGCLHEHIRDGWLCATHASGDRSVCRTCAYLPGDLAHDCPIMLTPLPAEVMQP